MQTFNASTDFTTSAAVRGQFTSGTFSADSALPVAASDTIYVSAVQFGKTLLDRVTLTGYSSVNEIISAVSALLGQVQGIVTVNIRNRDNGWRASRPLRLRRPSMSMLAMA